MNSTNKNLKLNIGISLLVLGFIFFRDFYYFSHPRIHAEEGTVYIQAIINSEFFSSFFQGHLGYYSLFDNVIMHFGLYLLPLKKLAYFTTYASALFTFLICISPLILKSTLWNTPLKKMVLVLMPLIMSTEEMWLNTIHLQFYFGLFICYLYLSNLQLDSYKWYEKIYILILSLFAPFTSVISILITPFFVYRYLLEKTKALAYFVIILICGCFVQFYSLINTLGSGTLEHRFSLGSLKNIPEAIVWCLRYPGKDDWLPFALMSIMSVLFLLCLIFYVYKTGFKSQPLVLSIYFNVLLNFLSLDMNGAPRYFLIPSTLLMVYLLNRDKTSHYKKIRLILIIWILFKIIDFFNVGYYKRDWMSFENEYQKAIDEKSSTIPIFPKGENLDWHINLDYEKPIGYRIYDKKQ